MAGGAWTIHHPASSPRTRLSSGRRSSAWDLHPFSFGEHQHTLVFYFFFYTTNVNIGHQIREERLLKFKVLSCSQWAFRWSVTRRWSEDPLLKSSLLKRDKRSVSQMSWRREGVWALLSSRPRPLDVTRRREKRCPRVCSINLLKTRITRQRQT